MTNKRRRSDRNDVFFDPNWWKLWGKRVTAIRSPEEGPGFVPSQATSGEPTVAAMSRSRA